ncbi:hypothetical protein PABG_02423 [Paracoccidioides brasiliensis Pb03]|nr:hypothetical protein PABG_02423 [Paracoccidioides brasiliensis Pb03]
MSEMGEQSFCRKSSSNSNGQIAEDSICITPIVRSDLWMNSKRDKFLRNAEQQYITSDKVHANDALRAAWDATSKGVVLPIASIAGSGRRVYAKSLYAASKCAVVGFVRSMGPKRQLGVKVVGNTGLEIPLSGTMRKHYWRVYMPGRKDALEPERIAMGLNPEGCIRLRVLCFWETDKVSTVMFVIKGLESDTETMGTSGTSAR